MVSTLEQMTDEDRNLIGEYLKIEKCYRYALREMSARLENLDDNCSLHFAHNPIHHIESRVKTPAAIIEKIHRRGYPVTMEILKEKIYDIAGMRVICNYINDIYQIVTMMKQQKDLWESFVMLSVFHSFRRRICRVSPSAQVSV
jgi:putative GTP pyrophosphokinase